ncbi:MAG: hypothetical protein JNL82_37195 [Myxococcales bacterium]|nr:hypothetical protein [Myxococcales bacterium]
MTRTLLVLLGAALACGESGRDTSATAATGVTTAPATATATEAASEAPTGGTGDISTTLDGTGVDTGASVGTTEAVKFDIGSAETGGTTTGGMDGCTKIDFLFVIDNSASMEDNQAALIASFPGFIAAIEANLTATSDFHIMVVDTDDDGRCKQPCDPSNPDVPEFCIDDGVDACNAQLTPCDTTRGAGVVHPVGTFASNKVCPIAGGNRYMTQAEPDLASTFACVATVGTAGNPSERPMNGMVEALGSVINDPGGCNAGFLRDDAILVITFISDDPNKSDMGQPDDWYEAVVAAKNGDPSAVAVAGLIPVLDDLSCIGDGNIQGSHWRAFVELWGDHGIMGTVCAADYAPFFAEAVDIIDNTCDNFVPPV